MVSIKSKTLGLQLNEIEFSRFIPNPMVLFYGNGNLLNSRLPQHCLPPILETTLGKINTKLAAGLGHWTAQKEAAKLAYA